MQIAQNSSIKGARPSHFLSVVHLLLNCQHLKMSKRSASPVCQTKKPKTGFRFSHSYQVKLGNDVRLSLSHAYENGQHKRCFINIREFVDNKPSPKGVAFRPEELEYLIDEITKATNTPDLMSKSNIGDRTVIVKSFRQRDVTYNPSLLEDQIDGFAYKTCISIGFRHNNFSKHQTLDMDMAKKLLVHLPLIVYITNNLGNNLGEFIFDKLLCVVALKHLEKNPDNWYQFKHLRRCELKQRCEDIFDFYEEHLKYNLQLLCFAFAIPSQIFYLRFNATTLEFALVEYLSGTVGSSDSILRIMNNL